MAVPDSIVFADAVQMSRTGEARRIREQAGVPLAMLAADIGGQVSTLSRWERGLVKPTGTTAIAWAKLLRQLASKAA